MIYRPAAMMDGALWSKQMKTSECRYDDMSCESVIKVSLYEGNVGYMCFRVLCIKM
jgi:hypothetical protein